MSTTTLVVTAVVELGLLYVWWVRGMATHLMYQARAEGQFYARGRHHGH